MIYRISSVLVVAGLLACASPPNGTEDASTANPAAVVSQSDPDCDRAHSLCFVRSVTDGFGYGLTDVFQAGSRLMLIANQESTLASLAIGPEGLVEAVVHVTAAEPWSGTASDFDGDGILDIAVAHLGNAQSGGIVTLQLGLRSGDWISGGSLPTGSNTYSVVALAHPADEGAIVGVAASFDGKSLTPLIARPGSTPTVGSQLAIPMSPSALATGDVYRDGRIAIVAAGQKDGAGALTVARPTRDGRLEALGTSALGSALNAVAVADLDAEDPGMVLAADDVEDGSIFVVRWASHRADPSVVAKIPTASRPHAMAVGDLDLDGRLDLVVAAGGSGSLMVCRGWGGGSFGDCFDVQHGLKEPTDVAIADLDGDGRPELIAIGYEGKVSWLRRARVRD